MSNVDGAVSPRSLACVRGSSEAEIEVRSLHLEVTDPPPGSHEGTPSSTWRPIPYSGPRVSGGRCLSAGLTAPVALSLLPLFAAEGTRFVFRSITRSPQKDNARAGRGHQRKPAGQGPLQTGRSLPAAGPAPGSGHRSPGE